MVNIGRSRLPPEAMRWRATSGIIDTSEPARDRMISFTRSIAPRVNRTSGSMLLPAFRLPSSRGTTTPNILLRVGKAGQDNKDGRLGGQVSEATRGLGE